MQEHNISANNFENCLKCNICTTVCPMMAANPHYPGPKQAGPDGERYRLKDPAFFDKTLKFCLNCKRCEVACPSGVEIGDIIQIARLKYARQHNPVRDFTLANTDLLGSLAVPFAPVVNTVLGWNVTKQVMDAVIGVDKHRTFPKYSSQLFTTWFKKNAAPSQEAFPHHVSYFHGCYANYNYPQLGKDFVTVMNACNWGVHLLEKEKCCGVALISNGFKSQALKQAKVNVESIRKASTKGEKVLTTSTTCTFTIRDEYHNVLGLDSEDMKQSVILTAKWLYDKVEKGEIKLAFKDNYKKKIFYHVPCHMNKLGWGIYSQELMKMIPGVELVTPEQNCCGISGTFGFKKENYPYSQKIGSVLFDNIREVAPDFVATDCETCKWQIEMSTGYAVMNPISVLAEALDIEKTKKLNQ